MQLLDFYPWKVVIMLLVKSLQVLAFFWRTEAWNISLDKLYILISWNLHPCHWWGDKKISRTFTNTSLLFKLHTDSMAWRTAVTSQYLGKMVISICVNCAWKKLTWKLFAEERSFYYFKYVANSNYSLGNWTVNISEKKQAWGLVF